MGIFVGLLVALGYLWLGGLLIAVGFFFRAKPAWATVGVWAAVPVIVVSLGFGYVSFRSVEQDGSAPTAYRGSVALELTGEKLGPINVTGNGQCQYDGTGALRLRAGGGVGGTTIATPDGRQVYVQFDPRLVHERTVDRRRRRRCRGGARQGVGARARDDRRSSGLGNAIRVSLDAASRPRAVNSGKAIRSTERWSGKVTWSCSTST